MSLGASLTAGKLPKLKRIEPMNQYFDKNLKLNLPYRQFSNVHEQGKPIWDYWFKEVLPSRPSLSPFCEDHVIQALSEFAAFRESALADLLTDLSKLDKGSHLATSIDRIDLTDFTAFDNEVCYALTEAIKSNVLSTLAVLRLPWADPAICDEERWEALAEVIHVGHLSSLVVLSVDDMTVEECDRSPSFLSWPHLLDPYDDSDGDDDHDSYDEQG